MKKTCLFLLICAALSCKKNPPSPPVPPVVADISFSPDTVLVRRGVVITLNKDTLDLSQDVSLQIGTVVMVNNKQSVFYYNYTLADNKHLDVPSLPVVPLGKVKVTIVNAGKTFSSTDLTVVQRAQWDSARRLDSGIYNAVAFAIGSKGYVLTGSDYGYSYEEYYPSIPDTTYGGAKAEFLEYDPATDSWTKLPDFPGGIRTAAVGFSIGNKGYIGTGFDGKSNYYTDFWQYDADTKGWTKLPDFPGGGRQGAIGFAVGGKGYIGTGLRGTTTYNDMYEYDPAGQSWKKMADLPGATRFGAMSFVIGSAAYVGMGAPLTANENPSPYSDLWQFTPSSNSWSRKADLKDSIHFTFDVASGRRYPFAFSTGNKGYTGMGYAYFYEAYPVYRSDVREYDPVTNTWLELDSCPLYGWGSFSFVIGSNAYVGGGTYFSVPNLHSRVSYIYNSFNKFTRLP